MCFCCWRFCSKMDAGVLSEEVEEKASTTVPIQVATTTATVTVNPTLTATKTGAIRNSITYTPPLKVHKSHSDPGSILYAKKDLLNEYDGQLANMCPLRTLTKLRSAKKCFLTLDGYSYVIVASSPEAQKDDKDELNQCQIESDNKSESLTIVRRSNDKKFSIKDYVSCDHVSDRLLDTVDLAADYLPPLNTPEACDKAALRLRCLLRQLNKGEISAELLQRNLQFAACVLEAIYLNETKCLADDDDELSEVQPDAVPPEVREWLTSTFTRQLASTKRKAEEKPKFRSVAHAIRAGIFVDRIYRRVTNTSQMQFPLSVIKVLKTLDEWSFDVFALNEVSNSQSIKYLGYDLFNRYGIIHKFKVQPAVLENFLTRIEEGYCRYSNPYHNNLHAADVTQTVHYVLCQTGLMNWLSDLEIFATLFAALIHDYEHTGTTNNFHVMSGSETALLYNDRAVLENHHISASFRLLRDENCNILHHLSKDEYREFRTLVIDMVLATDMSYHFQQIKNIKSVLSLIEPTIDRSKVLALVLHCCDISHPAKRWNLHNQWTRLLLEEFFLQGDKERDLGLSFSPLCDRNNTLIAESQIGFIEFIVEPSMTICSELLEHVLQPVHSQLSSSNSVHEDGPSSPKIATKLKIVKPWIECLIENKKNWKELALKDADQRNKEGNAPPQSQ